ncbi:kinase-like protein [Guyanagaster necrorhizus]|uniref:Kinase-like protein n=1 Tax=Guyanagaster necrorhizus TaxID=856835 RepID=A0A9P7W1S7_9AGAR|nr:kinase-like protein [Guyanagaster necrorhizus MCA 3950]KAG7450450.1 kinase-like protein [Guyanagaster necrorhizus MCA 3950]
MLSAPPQLDLAFDSEEWTPQLPARLYRAASVGSWGVTSIGRGFDWDQNEDASESIFSQKGSPQQKIDALPQKETPRQSVYEPSFPKADEASLGRKTPGGIVPDSAKVMRLVTNVTSTPPGILTSTLSTEPSVYSRSSSPLLSTTPGSSKVPTPSRSPTAPQPRRRSSQQRVSLIAGRVSIAPIEPPSPPPILPKSLNRADSTSSLLSVASSTRAPSPARSSEESFLGERTISEFHIEGEIGRGAYGLVKRAREILDDGSLGPPLVIKQVIKSRILADCWKKHPKHGTIPIEIYVMSAISNTSYVLPSKRPWDPRRFDSLTCLHNPTESGSDEDAWVEGKTVKGHPNICPLLDFFEDSHYYYLVLPSSTPEHGVDDPPPPSDLFDLVESYPQGLPPASVRTYLGQIADALCFLHSHGIVHRDVKDENVVLGPHGRCILIDFGSSGLVKKNGWDSFSGTLDYAGPEILRGERYQGKEQDVWAFGVVAYVLLVGECPFMTAAEAQEGLDSPFASASMALDERCSEERETDGEEQDGGGALGDAAALVRACLRLQVSARPTFETILQSRFLAGNGGWTSCDS